MNNKIKRIVFLGAPGSGKGTQCALLGNEFPNIHVLSTGFIFRDMVRNGNDELAEKLRYLINQGILVSDDITFEIVKKEINTYESNASWLLDGFPRNINQARMLDDFVQVTDVVFLDVKRELLYKRLTGRRIAKYSKKIYNIYFNPPKQEGVCDITGEMLIQREDDLPEVVDHRFNIFYEEIDAILKFYDEKGILKRINAEGGIEEIFSSIKESLAL